MRYLSESIGNVISLVDGNDSLRMYEKEISEALENNRVIGRYFPEDRVVMNVRLYGHDYHYEDNPRIMLQLIREEMKKRGLE